MPFFLKDVLGNQISYGVWLLFLTRNKYSDGCKESSVYLFRCNNAEVTSMVPIVIGNGVAAFILTEDFKIKVLDNTNKISAELTAIKISK